MKHIFFIAFLFVFLLSIKANANWFQEKTIYSNALGLEKTYYIGLPDGYDESDTTQKYMTIIFLHGASVTASELVSTLEPYLSNALYKILFAKLFKVIFVIPDGYCSPYKGSFYTNSELYGNYEDYIVNDIVNEVNEKYHTYKDRAKIAIMGHSMGGYGAMKIALKHPDLFKGVASLSGPLDITYYNDLLPLVLAEHGTAAPYDLSYSGSITSLMYSMAGAFSPNVNADPPVYLPITTSGTVDSTVMALWGPHNPTNLVKDWSGSPQMSIYMYCDKYDELKLATQNQIFEDTLSKYSLPFTYYEDAVDYSLLYTSVSLPNHTSSLVTSFPKGLNFLYSVMDTSTVGTKTNEIQYAKNTTALYPNPASSRLYVESGTNTPASLEFFDLTGSKILQVNEVSNGAGVDISMLKKGIYIVSVHDEQGQTSFIKIVKK